MKAMLLAAGYGSRLGELTKEKPKPLMEAGGKPLITHVLEKFSREGVSDVVVNIHYLREVLESYLRQVDIPGLSIHISNEDELLGIGGGIKAARRWLCEDGDTDDFFIAHNSDVFCDFALREMVAQHTQSGALATLATRRRTTARYLLFNDRDEMVGWENTKRGERILHQADSEPCHRRAFSGVYVLSKRVFELFPDSEKFHIINFFLDAVEKGEKVQSFAHDDSYWKDVGTPETLSELDEYLSKTRG